MPVLTQPAPRTLTAELGPVPADFTTEEAAGARHQGGDQQLHHQLHHADQRRRTSAWSPTRSTAPLVMPGETFSLNDVHRPARHRAGLRPGRRDQRRRVHQAVGGGISQFATTMFNAVFFAGLEDVHHKPHSFYISRYPAGREATVYDGLIDLAVEERQRHRRLRRHRVGAGLDHRHLLRAPSATRSSRSAATGRNVTAAGGAGEAGRRRAASRSPGAQGFDITVTRVFKDLNSGRGDPAGELPHPLRRRGDHPLRPAARRPTRRPTARRRPGRRHRRTTSVGPADGRRRVGPTA